jgi:hypothetical protein
LKKVLAGFVSGVIVATAASVYADDGLQKIEAYLRPALPIVLDGKKLELQNPPLIYDGSTYLPLREMAGVFSKAVNWNEETQTVELGKLSSTTEIIELHGYISDSAVPAIKYNERIYLPARAGVDKYGIYHFTKYDSATKSYLFDKTDISVSICDSPANSCRSFNIGGDTYIEESLLIEAKNQIMQTLQPH